MRILLHTKLRIVNPFIKSFIKKIKTYGIGCPQLGPLIFWGFFLVEYCKKYFCQNTNVALDDLSSFYKQICFRYTVAIFGNFHIKSNLFKKSDKWQSLQKQAKDQQQQKRTRFSLFKIPPFSDIYSRDFQLQNKIYGHYEHVS